MLYDKNGVFTGTVDSDIFNSLAHYGTPRHSGRYPWGSGDNPYQRNESFLGQVDKLKKMKDANGRHLYSEKQIAAMMNMNTSELRKRVSLANAENRAYLSSEAKRLKEKGMSTSAIARRMGRNESSIRLLLDEGVSERMSKPLKNAQLLKDRLDEEPGTYVQVGAGTEYYLNGASAASLRTTLKLLENEGYTLHDIPVEQLGTGKTTTVKVLAKPGTEWKEVMNNKSKIKLPTDIYAENNGEDLRKIKEYVSIDPKRIQINYPSTGGTDKDGVIELRRGVDDISLGKNHYAQVRILVDGTHYLKGMAMYADNLPPGVDIRFNTSKPDGTPMFKTPGIKDSVLKPIKEELENPFGANIKPDEKITKAQLHYIDKDGVERQSAINIVKEEGDVNSWNRTLASQFLSKQPPELAKHQLKMAYDISKSDFEEIKSYNNPTVKAKMLEDFAGRCESDAVHLSAAALPRQNNKFILPLTDIRENEIYAPGYRDGEEVVLVRYPHASISEIPRLIVNNKNRQGRETIGDPATVIDAVGIHHKAAERLSGADFDGDTVLVIPTSTVNIANKPQFEKLKGFDDKAAYPYYEGMHVMTKHEHGLEMGKISNLITDMTIKGAKDDEICRALKHSMVVVDAEKHKLDYRRSEIENGIAELRERYQAGPMGGSSTFLSRSTSPEHIVELKEKAPSKMNPEEKKRWENGEIIYEKTGRLRPDDKFPLSRMTPEEKKLWKSGDDESRRQVRAAMYSDGRAIRNKVEATVETKKGYVYDPYELTSTGNRDTAKRIERIYADYAMQMKELAREARKEARAQVDIERDPEMAKIYSSEVESLKAKLSIAKRNAPLERQAQIKAKLALDQIVFDHPEIKDDKEHYKREKFRQLDAARRLLGAKKLQIGTPKNPLTDREWEAIQKGAVSKTVLRSILNNADMGRIRELAMPKTKTGIPTAKLSRVKSMIASGYSRADICDMLDISEGKLVYAIENGLV